MKEYLVLLLHVGPKTAVVLGFLILHLTYLLKLFCLTLLPVWS